MKELLLEIRKDPNYRKLQQKYEQVSGSLDLGALYKEATITYVPFPPPGTTNFVRVTGGSY